MEILHVSAECYPMAKAGGLADVAGALPKYEQQAGHVAKLVMPMHRTKFLYENTWEVVHKGKFDMAYYHLDYTIIKEKYNQLGFDLYCVDIHGLLDRENIYSYDDDAERFMSFQIAVTDWLSKWEHQPDILHIHDHHTALIPFMKKYCYAYRHLADIPVVLTIHNAQYQGWMSWDKAEYLPAWDSWRWGLLDWNDTINPLACGIKVADRVTTVSPGYMAELMYQANGLETLISAEAAKCSGIINGIDYEVWNPATDSFITDNFDEETLVAGKKLNRKKLCNDAGLKDGLPLFIFIGRLVADKGADLLAEVFTEALETHKKKLNILVLGSGNAAIQASLQALNEHYPENYHAEISYNEKLSHQMYAGADFLMMPSRVEPCGLNQLYAMRYGTVPIVRRTGGLENTVVDFGENGGYGILFSHAAAEDILHAINRAIELHKKPALLKKIRHIMMTTDNSWEASTKKYVDLYSSIKN